MQHSPLSFLLVDDHPFILEAYKNGIVTFCEQPPIFYEATDCKSGYELIHQEGIHIDIAFFDISMPHFYEKDIKSGLDLALLTRKIMPHTKIVILSMHSEIMQIEEIFDQIAPEGMIIKNDLSFTDLVYMLERINAGDTFYSETIVKMIHQQDYRFKAINKLDKIILQRLLSGEELIAIAHDLKIDTNILQKRLRIIAFILGQPEQTNPELIAQLAKENNIL